MERIECDYNLLDKRCNQFVERINKDVLDSVVDIKENLDFFCVCSETTRPEYLLERLKKYDHQDYLDKISRLIDDIKEHTNSSAFDNFINCCKLITSDPASEKERFATWLLLDRVVRKIRGNFRELEEMSTIMRRARMRRSGLEP